MADALERITNLVALLLETRAPVTLEQIINELGGQYPAGDGAARGAFERDKAMLREIGVPIESQVLAGSDAGKTAYRIDRRRYELADLDLAADERQALQMAVAAARLSEGEFGLLKLGADGVAAATVVTNIPDVPALPALREASAQHATATFGYHGTPRQLQPYALLLREGFWYVIGRDVTHDALRTYRVDRIDGDVEVGEANVFTRPADFDPRRAFPSDPKLIGGEPASRATVHVDGPRASVVLADVGEDAVLDRLADGAVRVSVPCANLDAFRSWLFGLGAYAEVLDPPEVRASVVEWLRSMVVTP
jgi:predicted DNA-binding transcriptional regulator YafY